mgnify:FL=1
MKSTEPDSLSKINGNARKHFEILLEGFIVFEGIIKVSLEK